MTKKTQTEIHIFLKSEE